MLAKVLLHPGQGKEAGLGGGGSDFAFFWNLKIANILYKKHHRGKEKEKENASVKHWKIAQASHSAAHPRAAPARGPA